jgi:hypothetical protein
VTSGYRLESTKLPEENKHKDLWRGDEGVFEGTTLLEGFQDVK